jgi:hypothetical protein
MRLPLAGFTGSDWFQIGYPLVLFVLGYLIGERKESNSVMFHNVDHAVYAPLTLSRIVTVHTPAPPPPTSPKLRHEARDNEDELEPQVRIALVLLGFFVALAVLALAFLKARDGALFISATLIFLTLGFVTGIVRRRVQLGLFSGDWAVAGIIVLGLAVFATACGYFLLHPLKAPPQYSTLFDAYSEEGFSALLSFDSNVWLFAFQALGMFALVMGCAVLLYLCFGLVSQGSILAGAQPTWWRRFFARAASSAGAVAGLLAVVLALLAVAFLWGSGIAAKQIHGFGEPRTPQLLVSRVRVDPDGLLHVTGVATATGLLRITVESRRSTTHTGGKKAAAKTKSRQVSQYQARLIRGRVTLLRQLPRRQRSAEFVILTPLRLRHSAGDPTGDPRRFRCSPGGCTRVAASSNAPF